MKAWAIIKENGKIVKSLGQLEIYDSERIAGLLCLPGQIASEVEITIKKEKENADCK